MTEGILSGCLETMRLIHEPWCMSFFIFPSYYKGVLLYENGTQKNHSHRPGGRGGTACGFTGDELLCRD